ncbi:MAG: MFS transporter [Desulfobacterium sp.]
MNDIQKTFTYDKGIKIKLIASSILLLVLALGFNTLLSLSSLEDIYVGSTFSKYSAIGNDLKRNIEKSLKFGKKLDKFVGLNTLLQETRTHLTKKNPSNFFKKIELIKANSDLSVSLALPDNRIYYSTESALIHQQLPLEVSGYFNTLFTPHEAGEGIGKNYYKSDHKFYIGLPIKKHKRWMGTLIIILPEDQVKAFTHALLLEKMKLTGMILLGVLVVLLGFFFVVIPGAPEQTRFSKRKISGVILVVLLLAQISFSLLNTNSFKNCYLEITREKTAVLGSLLREDIEFMLSKGIALDRLSMMEHMLGEIIKASPELSDITLLDSDRYPLYKADKNNILAIKKEQRGPLSSVHTIEWIKDSKYHHNIVLHRNNALEADVPADIAGYISITISKKVLLSELTEIIMDAITVLVISLLFLMELLVIVFQYFAKEMAVAGKIFRVHYTAIRPAVFIYFFGQTISVSFLPLYMEQFGQPFWGLSREVIMGLPICATMLFGAISPLIAGPWVDKRGWHESFFAGLILTSAGFVYTWMAPNAVHLIISRAFVGFGYGLTFMAANGFVVAFTDENSKAQGFTRLIAGCYAGYICGSSTGGMLADSIGYNAVFMVGAVIIVLSFIYTMIFLKGSMEHPKVATMEEGTEQSAPGGMDQLLQFIITPRVLALCLLVIFPSSMMAVGFLNYFIPIYIDRIGSTPSHIGRLMMVYGLFFIYVAPVFSKYIDRSLHKSRYILLSGILSSCGLMLFYFYGGMTAAVLSVLVLGLAGSLEASTPYVLGLENTKKLGSAKAIAILSSVEKLGQVLGPIVFGWLILGQPNNNAIYYMGIACLIIVLLFYLISCRNNAPVRDEA